MTDEALYSTQRFGEGEYPEFLQDRIRLVLGAHFDGDHPTEASHLLLGELVLRMRRQPRVDHFVFADLLSEPGSNAAPVRIVTRHAKVKRFRSTKCEP